MTQFTPGQFHPIGLDVGRDTIRMLQLQELDDGLSVVAAAKAAVPQEAQSSPRARATVVIALIRRMLGSAAFHGRRIVTALPQELVHTRTIRVPALPATGMPSAIAAEAGTHFPFCLSEASFDFLYAGEVRQGSEVCQEAIVLASRNADIANYLKVMDRAGVEVVSLDVPACALYRTIDRFTRRSDDLAAVRVLVDVGSHGSQVVIGKGREINFIKSVEVGGWHFNRAISAKLGISMDEAGALRRRLADSLGTLQDAAADPVRLAASDALRGVFQSLAKDIALCLQYYTVTFRGVRPASIRLMGDEATDKMLRKSLTAALPIPIDLARPLHSIDTSRVHLADRAGAMADWAVALGLALRQVKRTFGPRDGAPRESLLASRIRAVSTEIVIDLTTRSTAAKKSGSADPAEKARESHA